MIKIICASDTHSKNLLTKWEWPPGDILIHAGDMTAHGKDIEKVAREMLELPYRYKIVIAGNHDRCFWEGTKYSFDYKKMPGIIVLQDETVELMGLRIYGTSWLKFEGGKHPFEVQDLKSKWAAIPSGINILITHMPPYGIMDIRANGEHGGSTSLTQEVKMRVMPELHVFGHMHAGYGTIDDGITQFVNASLVDNDRQIANQPIVINLK